MRVTLYTDMKSDDFCLVAYNEIITWMKNRFLKWGTRTTFVTKIIIRMKRWSFSLEWSKHLVYCIWGKKLVLECVGLLWGNKN